MNTAPVRHPYLASASYLFRIEDLQSQPVGTQVVLQAYLQRYEQEPDRNFHGVIEDQSGTQRIVVPPLHLNACHIQTGTIVSIAGSIIKDPQQRSAPAGKEKKVLVVHLAQPSSPTVFSKRNPVDLIPKRCTSNNSDVQKLGAWIDLIFNEPLSKFIRSVFSDPSISHPFAQAAASWKSHHNHPGGLLQHSVEVADLSAQMMLSSAVSIENEMYELGIIAALLHDLGKIHHLHQPYTRSLLDHQALTLEKLAPHLSILDDEWPDGGTALRHLLTGYESRFRTTMTLLSIIKAADRISAQSELESFLFDKGPADRQYVKSTGPGTPSSFWRPRLNSGKMEMSPTKETA